MAKKTLLETNPFLKDPAKRRDVIKTVVISSSAIEGVHAAAEIALSGKTRKSANAPSPSSSSRKQR